MVTTALPLASWPVTTRRIFKDIVAPWLRMSGNGLAAFVQKLVSAADAVK